MTVAVNDTIERYVIAGAGPYPYSWRIFNDTDLQVYALSTASPPVPTLLTYLTHYTVSGANDAAGGSVTLLTAAFTPYAGYTLDIRANTPEDQPTSIRNQARFLPEIHEDAFDYLSRQIQDLRRLVNSSVRTPDNEPVLPMILPPVATRAGKYNANDALGQPIASAGTGNDSALRTDLANTASGNDGARLVGVLQSGTGAQGRTVANKLKNILTIFDFLTPTQITDVENGTGSIDVTSGIQAAITAAGSTKRRRIYAPAGVYKHTGFSFPLSGVGMFGDGDNETVFAYAGGAADTVTVAAASHRVTLERMTLRGNAACTSVLKWTAAADGALNRVLLEANGGTQNILVLQEGSFYFVCNDSMIDGGLTAPMGVLMRNNGAASGPNSSVFRDTRVQQVTQCFDVRDGNNIRWDNVYMENTVSLGARIWAPIRNAWFTGCRVDTAVNGAIGVQVDVGAQDTLLDEMQWDMSGVAPVLLADSGSRTQRREGSQLIGKPIVSPAMRIVDVAGNPFIELVDNVGQVAVIQHTSNLLDLFSATGKGFRVRTNGGTATPLQMGAGNTIGFFGTAAIAKPTVTGAKAGNAALTSALTQLAALGLITDSST